MPETPGDAWLRLALPGAIEFQPFGLAGDVSQSSHCMSKACHEQQLRPRTRHRDVGNDKASNPRLLTTGYWLRLPAAKARSVAQQCYPESALFEPRPNTHPPSLSVAQRPLCRASEFAARTTPGQIWILDRTVSPGKLLALR